MITHPLKLLLFIVLFFVVVVQGHASDSLITWRGELRARGEIDGRDFQNQTPPNLYAQLRTRLGAEVRPSERVFVMIQFQDSRLFGQSVLPGAANTTADLKNIDLHQGFVRVSNFLTRGFSAAFGRMELSYGNERVVGVNDWVNTSRAFDGALLRYQWSGHIIDLIGADIVDFSVPPQPVSRGAVAGTGSEGFLLSGIHYANTVLSDLEINLYGFHEWSHRGSSTTEIDRSRFTLGGLFKGRYSGILYDAEGAYQLGEQETSDVSAFMALGALGYSFDNTALSSITAGFEHLSGTAAGSSKVKAFHAPFATGHRSFGYMDYFTAIPVQTYSRGLQDMYLRIILTPVKHLVFSMTGHNFRLVEEYVGRKNLGQEVDLVISWMFDSFVTFETGAGAFIPDEIMEFEFGGTDPGFWGYSTVRVGF